MHSTNVKKKMENLVDLSALINNLSYLQNVKKSTLDVSL